jgi:micrococcal nuclease
MIVSHKIALTILIICTFLCATVFGNTLTIAKVISGDEFELEDGQKVFFVGIDTPDEGEYLYLEVFDFVKRQLEGKLVACRSFKQRDVEGKDAYYDEDGYFHMQIEYQKDFQVDLNVLLLEKGYARVDENDLPEELKHYREIERQARENKLGIWAEK